MQVIGPIGPSPLSRAKQHALVALQRQADILPRPPPLGGVG